MKNSNPDLELAEDYIRETGCHIFLTGKAGTGKTTFLHFLKKNSPKRMAVTAPTGVAAINAAGVTLHSFFQLPFGPYLPGMTDQSAQFRFSKEKINIIKSLDLLVIDEISMVRADLLDSVDAVLRRYRRSNLPFAGVQLLMIGDLFQLPPVVKNEEWQLLRQHYESPYFFSSHALGRAEMTTIELKKIYRQADDRFIDILNQVRNNALSPAAVKILQSRTKMNVKEDGADGAITLCTHNNSADRINRAKLEEIPAKLHGFEAVTEGEFPEHSYPTASHLHLKQGAQVMFVRNDQSYEKRYFNGKIGTIVDITKGNIRIKCPEDADVIEVEPVMWENFEYSFDQEKGEIRENKIGSFTQYPLRLAWAITIHKSQGLTFDKAVIDAEAAFAHGQVYVALSRCRTLEGLVLSTPLSSATLKIDDAVLRFTDISVANRPDARQLEKAKIRYQQQLLLECFDFTRLRSSLRRFTSLLLGNKNLLHVSGMADIAQLQENTESAVCTVGDNFKRQLQGLFRDAVIPAEDPLVLERIAKASSYFGEKITPFLSAQLAEAHFDSDNKDLLKKVRNAFKHLEEETALKLAAVQSCAEGFSPAGYFAALSAAAIEKKESSPRTAAAPTYTEADIAHPEFFQILKDWRSRQAQEQGVPHFHVLHQKTLIQIVVHLPGSLAALKKIKGIGKKLAEKYGEELVGLVCRYREDHAIDQVILPDLPQNHVEQAPQKVQKEPAVNTKQATFTLFSEGLSLKDIAEKRGLTLATIEGHMAHFVRSGEVPIGRLLSDEILKSIAAPIALLPEKTSLREIKQSLGAEISYGEIQLVLAHLAYCSSSPS